MSEGELLANLKDRFALLASGSRTAPERQQTMLRAIDWSHRLLTPDEVMLFRRLDVFQGGFTLEAVRAVSSEPGANALGTLTGLVQKSMVVADWLEDGSTRYRLLESHHDFAHDKLVESGELDAIHRRHFEFFASQKWRPRESPNFWSALVWARDNADDAGLALAVELAESEISDQATMRKLLMERLGLSPERDAARARGLNIAARLASRQADHHNGRMLADESLDLARELGDSELIAYLLRGAGAVYHASGQMDVSRRMYDEALTLLEKSPNQRLAFDLRNQIGLIANERGDFASALEILNECVAFSRSNVDRGALEQYLESLANAQFGLGDIDGAAASWTEALAICKERDDPIGIIWSLGGLVLVAAARNEDERALRLAVVVERVSREYSFTAWSFRLNQINEAVERTRKKLGPRRSEQTWNEALTMTTSSALEYAVADSTSKLQEAVDAGPLSRREREVAAMVASGMTNKEIAQRLFIAERTAEGHVERIRNKLGVRSRTEVATWAVAHGLGPRQP
jgi:non-specific serine/threonine protein kinase